MKREVIGCWVICNNASLNLYEIVNGIEDAVVAGINDDEPKEYTLKYNDDGEAYIEFGGEEYLMNDCIRID